MRRAVVAVAVLLIAIACHREPQPAETNTAGGNATDRNPATGTTGTGEPVSPSASTTAAAQQLGTAGTPTTTVNGTAVAVTGTEDIHAAKTETTSTISSPGVTTTMSA